MSANDSIEIISNFDVNSRMSEKFLMSSPIGIVSIYAINLILNCYFIPSYMKNRKAFSFKKIFHFADVLIVIKCCYFIGCGIYYYFWRLKNFDPLCIMLNERDPFEAESCWQFLMSRFVDLLQNFAYSFGKRGGPVAVYLLVHHTIYPLAVWGVLSVYPGGHATMFGIINCTSHLFISSFKLLGLAFKDGPINKYSMPVIVWTSQLEFLLIFLHSFQVLFNQSCQVPRAYIWFIVLAMPTFSLFHAIMLQKPKRPEISCVCIESDLVEEGPCHKIHCNSKM